jgi:hypothetical protein
LQPVDAPSFGNETEELPISWKTAYKIIHRGLHDRIALLIAGAFASQCRRPAQRKRSYAAAGRSTHITLSTSPGCSIALPATPTTSCTPTALPQRRYHQAAQINTANVRRLRPADLQTEIKESLEGPSS